MGNILIHLSGSIEVFEPGDLMWVKSSSRRYPVPLLCAQRQVIN
jgi:hypothetical protein